MAMLKAISSSFVLILAGCQSNPGGEGWVGSRTQAAITANAITVNAITANAITANAITANSLDASALITTEEGREFLRYLILCALPDGASITSQHEGQTYQFDGHLGLASEWSQRALDETEKNWLSACLLSHVNAFGTPVQISLRAPGMLDVTAEELSDYKVYEATFFGRVFGDDPAYYACIGDDDDVALANSPDRALRICADDTDDCIVQSLGRCRDVCETRTADQGWTDCWADGVRYSESISAYLHSPDDDGNNQTCGAGNDCKFKIHHAGDGILDCSEADECRTTCKDDSICALDGTGANEFRAKATHYAIADVNCHETNECRVSVRHHSSVEIDCKDANDCSGIICKGGSDCLLDCTGAADCGFQVCQGQLNYCGSDIVVCNRPCP